MTQAHPLKVSYHCFVFQYRWMLHASDRKPIEIWLGVVLDVREWAHWGNRLGIDIAMTLSVLDVVSRY